MYDQMILKALAGAGATIMLIMFVYMVKGIIYGINKTKDVAGFVKEELEKVDKVIQKLSYSEDPNFGKVETICFHLPQQDESLFYAIPPKYIKRLRTKLENSIKSMPDTQISYGRQYAERQFYIGSTLIFSWQNEVKV